MAGNLKIADLNSEAKEKIKKFRFRQHPTNAAIVLKIDPTLPEVHIEEEYEDISLEELVEELPSSQPRFVLFSYWYKHDDGRTSHPLCFIFITPSGCKPELQMMYSGTKSALIKDVDATKVFEVRGTEELTEEWLAEKMKLFR